MSDRSSEKSPLALVQTVIMDTIRYKLFSQLTSESEIKIDCFMLLFQVPSFKIPFPISSVHLSLGISFWLFKNFKKPCQFFGGFPCLAVLHVQFSHRSRFWRRPGDFGLSWFEAEAKWLTEEKGLLNGRNLYTNNFKYSKISYSIYLQSATYNEPIICCHHVFDSGRFRRIQED